MTSAEAVRGARRAGTTWGRLGGWWPRRDGGTRDGRAATRRPGTDTSAGLRLRPLGGVGQAPRRGVERGAQGRRGASQPVGGGVRRDGPRLAAHDGRSWRLLMIVAAVVLSSSSTAQVSPVRGGLPRARHHVRPAAGDRLLQQDHAARPRHGARDPHGPALLRGPADVRHHVGRGTVAEPRGAIRPGHRADLRLPRAGPLPSRSPRTTSTAGSTTGVSGSRSTAATSRARRRRARARSSRLSRRSRSRSSAGVLPRPRQGHVDVVPQPARRARATAGRSRAAPAGTPSPATRAAR